MRCENFIYDADPHGGSIDNNVRIDFRNQKKCYYIRLKLHSGTTQSIIIHCIEIFLNESHQL